MEVGESIHFKTRSSWRTWLAKNHDKETEIWVILFKKDAGVPGIAYNAAVEEALCYGWIDGIVKKLDDQRRAQRFTPRRPKSNLSEMNKERARRLMAAGKMTKAGLVAIADKLDERFVIADDITKALKRDPVVWKNFRAFPESYKRIRVGWIEGARNRPDVFQTRLAYFIKMTAQNKTYGMVQ